MEWRVTVPHNPEAQIKPNSEPRIAVWHQLAAKLSSNMRPPSRFMKNAWRMGVDDPQKFIHCVKVGLALALVSIFYYTRPLYQGLGGAAMWAIMTIVVIFEFTVGGTLYKGLNRVMATLSAGMIAVGIHWLASISSETSEHIIIGVAAFILSSAATFVRFVPIIKARFDYGVLIFILTFNLVAISGYRVDRLLELAQQRLTTIAIGISICLLVCILIRPVWAGEELHLRLGLESSNVLGELASSIESMKKSSSIEVLIGKMSEAVEEMQNVLSSPPIEGTKPKAAIPTVPLVEAMEVITVASLLNEVTLRIEGVADAVEDLAETASFRSFEEEWRTEKNKSSNKVPKGSNGHESNLQLV